MSFKISILWSCQTDFELIMIEFSPKSNIEKDYNKINKKLIELFPNETNTFKSELIFKVNNALLNYFNTIRNPNKHVYTYDMLCQ